jgi:hypothetical protein
MTSTLTFDLSNPEDQMAHYRCVKALDMALCLFRIRELIYAKQYDTGEKLSMIAAEIMEMKVSELTD